MRGPPADAHDHGTRHPPAAVVDRRGRIFNGEFGPVAPYQDAVRSQTYGLVFLYRLLHRIARGFARYAVDNLKDFGKGTTYGLLDFKGP